MIYRKLTKWEPPAKTDQLIFFAQLLEEMLFEYSLDTYKASVMHTGLLCKEALNTIKDVEAGIIKQPNVFHITSELATNFETDSIAMALSPLPPSSFIPALRNPKTPLRELQTVLELLSVQLSSGRYHKKAQELLLSAVKSNTSIDEVRRLTRAYVTTLTAIGFSKSYLYETTKEFFHYGPNSISTTESLSDFFSLFPSEPRKYTAVFKVDNLFEHVAPAFDNLNLKIAREVPADLDIKNFPDVYRPAEPSLYAIITDIPARDPFSAREIAEFLLRLASTLLNLFHHKENPCWRPESIILDTPEV